MSQPLTPSLATGAALTPETWADFVARLKHHVRDEGVREHYTADALFIVQARRWVYGLDPDYCSSDDVVGIVEETTFETPRAYWDECDEDTQAAIDKATAASFSDATAFLELTHPWNQWDALKAHNNMLTVTGRAERWDYVGAHLTREAADAFIARKKHDYSDGIRVYVDSRQYAWEFTAVLDAIIDGRLVLALDGAKDCAHTAAPTTTNEEHRE